MSLLTLDELEWSPELEQQSESYTGSTSETDLARSAIRNGNTNETSLSNLVFFRRHPERNGAAISRNERNFQTLANEWLNIRNRIVRPLLQERISPPSYPSYPSYPAPTPPPPSSGSIAARVVAEAQKHIGFQEGPNNENPFSNYFNVPNVAWCAYFVSYVYTKAGLNLNIGSSDGMLNYLRTRGQFFPNTTAPQPGDIVIFDWSASDHDPAEHVGLVEKVYRNSSGQTRVGTIEGNSSNGVNRRDYTLGDPRIVGFGRPPGVSAVANEFGEFESPSESENDFELEWEEEATFDFTQEVPPSVRSLLPPSGRKDEQREKQAAAQAITLGDRNENHLSDIIFFNRHPERNGRFIAKAECNQTDICREWIAIRDAIVRPALRGGTPNRPTPPSTTTALNIHTMHFADDRFTATLTWDQVIGMDTQNLNIELIASISGRGSMPASIAIELTSRAPNGVNATPTTLATPVRLNVPKIGPDPASANRTVYRLSQPVDQVGDFLKVERQLKEVATIVRQGGSSDVSFRRALGWNSRGAATQPIVAGASTGSEARETPDARTLFRAAGVEVLEAKVPAQSGGTSPAPIKRLIRSPADIVYYSGHGYSRTGKLLIDLKNKQCPQHGVYRDWLGASDLIPVWKTPSDLDILILAGCSVLNIDYSKSTPVGPGLQWSRLLVAKGGPLAALLGYRAGAPCDQPTGNKIAEQMAKRIARGSTNFASDWLEVNGDNNANNAVALNARGYWWIEGTFLGGYDIKGPKRIP